MNYFGIRPDTSFYDVLEAQARTAREAAQTFYALTGDLGHVAPYMEKLERIEQDADTLHEHLAHKVNAQFLTCLDREDMQTLTNHLDAVAFGVKNAGSRINLYRLARPRPDLESFSCLLVAITQQTQEMVCLLRRGFGGSELCGVIAGIHALEHRAQVVFEHGLTAMFSDPALDHRLLVAWKDVYERMETAIRECDRLARFVESLSGKYA